MKLCIAGKNNIAVDCLSFAISLLDKKEICVVLNRNDRLKNTWQKSLGFFAKKEGIEIKTLEEVEKIADIVFLSLEFDRIVKPEKFNTNRLYNIHFSFLPEFKGMYTSLLPILLGKKYSGVTLHKIDRGIDTGDIIKQKKFEISGLTSYQLYCMYLNIGTEMVCKNMETLLEHEVHSLPQSPLNSTYYSKSSFNFNNKEIEVNQTAHQISTFVQALTFRPYQMAVYGKHQINNVVITKIKSTEKPGKVVTETDECIEINTIDYNVLLYIDYFNDLLECSRINDVEKAKSFIGYVKDINEIDENGWTPLMVACYHTSREMVLLLLNFGADLSLTNLNGTSMLMYAKDGYLKSDNKSVIDILLNKGANIYHQDIFGKTILDYLPGAPLKHYLLSYND